MSFTLNGETRIAFIVGDPIAQVKSPQNLSGILAERKDNTLVVPAHVKSDNVEAFFDAVKKMHNLAGIVITVPHKFAGIHHCDVLSKRADFVGSVNVITRDDERRWVGDNLDGIGYLDGVAAEGGDVKGKKALLVGTGGAGSAIAYEILERGAAHLSIFDLDASRVDSLLTKLEGRFPGRVAKGTNDPRGFDFVANATPAGMRADDPLPVDVSGLSSDQFVADVITNPVVSPLIQAARDRGCKTMIGAGMFNAQAGLLVDKLASK